MAQTKIFNLFFLRICYILYNEFIKIHFLQKVGRNKLDVIEFGVVNTVRFKYHGGRDIERVRYFKNVFGYFAPVNRVVFFKDCFLSAPVIPITLLLLPAMITPP